MSSFLSALILLSVTSFSALAAPSKDVVDGYTKMCKESVDMPKPFGESDLKGNASIDKYCQCIGLPYAERAMKAAVEMQNNVKVKKSADDIEKETNQIRNTCRKKFGLPAVKLN